jgi:hypothetical protein
MEGCYVRAQPSGTEVRIGTDAFAQLTMLYFSIPGLVAVSDSLLALISLRKHLGVPCRIDEEVVVARSWLNAMAAQQLSPKTAIRDVYYAPPGTSLSAHHSGTLSVSTIRAREFFSQKPGSYVEEIRSAASRSAALISTFLAINDAYFDLNLSGGQDSRACLAAVLRAGAMRRIRVVSNLGRPEDLAVAMTLGKTFGFDLNPPPGAKGVESINSHPMERWFLSNAGIYDPLHGGTPKSAMLFTIGGQGAEMCKGNYGWRTIAAIAKGIDGNGQRRTLSFARRALDVAEAFRREAESGLEAIGIEKDDPIGSEWHYLGYRNAIHSGRSTMVSLIDVRPFLQRSLIGLSRSDVNEFRTPKKGDPSIVTDLMIILCPELATIPFDKGDKNMTSHFVADRARYLGEVRQFEPYTVVGSPEATRAGLPDDFRDLVRFSNETRGGFKGSRVSKLAEMGWDAVPRALREVFLPKWELVRDGLEDPVTASTPVAMSAGKLMTFCLAD